MRRVAAGQGDAGAGGDRPRYLTPSEVQEVMRRMWARNPGILNVLFAIDLGDAVRCLCQRSVFGCIVGQGSQSQLLSGLSYKHANVAKCGWKFGSCVQKSREDALMLVHVGIA